MHKFLLILTLSLAACSHRTDDSQPSTSEPTCASAPAGFSVVEQSPRGYFIRLASAERVDASTIRRVAASFSSSFDRVDFCIDAAHERGDEYASVIDGKLFDYSADEITTLNTDGHE